MKFLHHLLEKQRPLFEKGGKLERFYYLFEAGETFTFTPPTTAGSRNTHVHDAIDLKRMMMTVVIAMIPALLFGIWNVGNQHALATGNLDADFMSKIIVGAIQVLPIVIVAYAAGGIVEAVFAVVRKHPINEGFLVTGMLIPLVMPPDIPLWQVALATVFAVVIAKEAFGGTGMNILNVALTARAFLYFAYPTDISGDVWNYKGAANPVEGYTGATYLAVAAETPATGNVVANADAVTQAWKGAEAMFSDMSLFLGTIPGSIGETSKLAILIGAAILLFTGVASWRIMVSAVIGALAMGFLCNVLVDTTSIQSAYMALPAYKHLLIGGFAFGVVFMATDPVSAAQTDMGKWIYGFLIGVITVIIRVFNPAYPEGIMLAILLLNVCAPLIDHYVIEANKKRRLKRATL
jgi:Na+-transporting NADH:ubiquinone oxidoreductase subunit B